MPQNTLSKSFVDNSDRSYNPKADKNVYASSADDTVDLSGPTQPGVVESGQVGAKDFSDARAAQDSSKGVGASSMAEYAPLAMQAAQSGGGGSASSGLDGIAPTALMLASKGKNPYLIGAGLFLSAYNSNIDAKNKVEQQKYDNMIQQSHNNVAAYDRMRNLV